MCGERERRDCTYEDFVVNTKQAYVLCMFWCDSHISISTLKQDCKAGIKLSLSDDGQHLIVTEVNEEHNHHINKVISKQCHYSLTSSILFP